MKNWQKLSLTISVAILALLLEFGKTGIPVMLMSGNGLSEVRMAVTAAIDELVKDGNFSKQNPGAGDFILSASRFTCKDDIDGQVVSDFLDVVRRHKAANQKT